MAASWRPGSTERAVVTPSAAAESASARTHATGAARGTRQHNLPSRSARYDSRLVRGRSHLVFAAVLLLGLALRLPGLGWFPSPAGDEGNWAAYGLEISRGRPAQLAPDAAFVSLLYAHLIAASIRVFGVTFVATRIVGVLGIAVAMVASYMVLTSLGARRAGLAVAAVLAVHPWAVMYS